MMYRGRPDRGSIQYLTKGRKQYIYFYFTDLRTGQLKAEYCGPALRPGSLETAKQKQIDYIKRRITWLRAQYQVQIQELELEIQRLAANLVAREHVRGNEQS